MPLRSFARAEARSKVPYRTGGTRATVSVNGRPHCTNVRAEGGELLRASLSLIVGRRHLVPSYVWTVLDRQTRAGAEAGAEATAGPGRDGAGGVGWSGVG